MPACSDAQLTLLDHAVHGTHARRCRVGQDEYSLVEALKAGAITKPVVAWVSGTCATLFKSEVQFGHAGAKSGGALESAQVCRDMMHDPCEIFFRVALAPYWTAAHDKCCMS